MNAAIQHLQDLKIISKKENIFYKSQFICQITTKQGWGQRLKLFTSFDLGFLYRKYIGRNFSPLLYDGLSRAVVSTLSCHAGSQGSNLARGILFKNYF